ncbi:MAG: hypothetical protein WBP85_12110 [Terracidiphilus sp.]
MTTQTARSAGFSRSAAARVVGGIVEDVGSHPVLVNGHTYTGNVEAGRVIVLVMILPFGSNIANLALHSLMTVLPAPTAAADGMELKRAIARRCGRFNALRKHKNVAGIEPVVRVRSFGSGSAGRCIKLLRSVPRRKVLAGRIGPRHIDHRWTRNDDAPRDKREILAAIH